jgi:hypothetical protein
VARRRFLKPTHEFKNGCFELYTVFVKQIAVKLATTTNRADCMQSPEILAENGTG